MKLIILDRDGVINFDSPDYIKSPDEWHPIPGSLEAIAELKRHDYKVAIATNQSGVGRGYYDLTILSQIHKKMMREIQKMGGYIDVLFFCPHLPDQQCICRKPKPGLLIQIGQYFQTDLRQAVMIGDSKRDIEAANAVGTKGILIATEKLIDFPDVPIFQNLSQAVQSILQQ